MPALLDDARPRQTPAREDGEFVDFGWRPIFKEHVNRQGVRFGREAMERIADRNNGRISESGDFCPIVIRHTKDDGSIDPEVIGCYGPYRCQQLPGRNGQPGKWAVYARERIYKEDVSKRRKYPRVSVEYWADEKDPTGGYFDPAALLGAETPELDLGFHYSADPSDPTRTLMRYQRVVHYEAVPAGGANTFVPSGTEEKPAQYQQGGTLSQADLQQIIAALKPSVEQAVSEAVGKMQPAGADVGEMNPAGASDIEGLGGDLGDDLGDGLGGDTEEPGAFADDDEDFENDDEPGSGGPDEVPAEHADLPEDDEDDTDPDDTDVEPVGKKKKSPYAKTTEHSDAGGGDAAAVVAGSPTGESFMETSEQKLTRYEKENTDYRKQNETLRAENTELRTKYEKEVTARRDSETNLQQLTERVVGMESRERRAVRYQKLGAFHAEGFTFDIEAELKDTESLDDAQFDRHCDRIRNNYQRVPLGGVSGRLASHNLQVAGPSRTDADDRRDARKRDRYSKLAQENVQRLRHEGKAADFKPEFERLMREDPEGISKQAA